MRCSCAGATLVAGALILATTAQLVLHSEPAAPIAARRHVETVPEWSLPERSTSPAADGISENGGSAQRESPPLATEFHGLPRSTTLPDGCSSDRLSFGPLSLNAHAKRLWSSCADGGVRAVFLTFGSHSMADFLLNWVAHVRKLDQRLYLVGALDAKMAALCDEQGIPAATIADDVLMKLGADSLGSRAATTYYRYAPGTFLRMGLIKQIFIRQMLVTGLDAMVSDVDVAWLQSPWPLVRYGDATQPSVRPSCGLLAFADVVLSVDQVQQYMDSDKHQWHVHSELNTGVTFFRNSPGALAVLDEWKEAMAKAIAAGNPNHDQYWLNEVLRPRTFHNLKLEAASRSAWLPDAAAHILATSTSKGGNAPVGMPTRADAFDSSDPNLRALFLFQRRFGSTNASVTIGTFPIAEISNGHTFFVQKLHNIVGVPPVCVHTTYQYGDGTTYAYGKRERLRDEHLWLLDAPQKHWHGRFLRLTSMPAKLLTPMRSELLQSEAIDPHHCVRSHLKLMMLQRQWLMDAFVLAKALERTLVFPPLWCMLDRFWTILNHCLIGSQVEMPQPFVCPIDHAFELQSMVGELEWREHSFFTNPRAPPELLASAVTLHVTSPVAGEAASRSASQLTIASGSTFEQAVKTIRGSQSAQAAPVLSIDAADLGQLCRCLGGLPEVHELSSRLPRLLAFSYDHCDTTDNPYFVECKKHGREGCRKHKTYLMNVSRGVQRPPPLPTSCEGDGQAQRSCLAYHIPKEHISVGVVGATSV